MTEAGVVLRGAVERALPPADVLGREAMAMAELLFPILRSLTGDGVRETLRLVAAAVPLETREVPSGTRVFDWTVPPEWNVREAWIADESGRRLVDLRDNPLHLLGYSEAVRARMSGAELQEHLHSLPDLPDVIPARTSYWERRWGFCLADRVRKEIRDDALYEVVIDATHDDDGSLTYAEAVIPGATEDEILVSTYTCHSGLANDGVSGIVVAALFGKYVPAVTLRHTVRLLFAPATIGAIAWLAANEERLGRIQAGFVVSCAGDRGPLTLKHTRRGDTTVDRAGALVVAERGGSTRGFEPWGTDERQFCSPGFDLPVVALTRTPHDLLQEHHTSDDNLSLLEPSALAGSIAAVAAIVDVVDREKRLLNLHPKGEPRLGDRGLYATLSAGVPGGSEAIGRAVLWVLNLSDGQHSLLDIAERSGLPFGLLAAAADTLVAHGMVAELDQGVAG
jgi:aminopeptidase-like protein